MSIKSERKKGQRKPLKKTDENQARLMPLLHTPISTGKSKKKTSKTFKPKKEKKGYIICANKECQAYVKIGYTILKNVNGKSTHFCWECR